MKKRFLNLLVAVLIIMPTIVNAAPKASATCSSSGTVTLNNTITVTVTGSSSDAMWDTTLSYDSSKLQYISGTALHDISDSFVTSITYTYTFKAVAEGTAYVKTSSAISDYDGEKAFPNSSCSINIVKPTTRPIIPSGNSNPQTPLSSDNNLKSLSVEGIEISPKFEKDVLEYTATVENNVDKVNIQAEAAHSKATISGNGEVEVLEGENKLKVVVKAENGATRTYTIILNRKEKDPINVKVDGDNYTVLRDLKDIKIPKYFEETTIKIDNNDIPSLKNKKTNYVLVGLKDNKGKISLYIYNNGKYTKYNELINYLTTINILKLKEVDINLPKKTIKINENDIEGYELYDDVIIIYGMNIETGKENYYTYNTKDKTFQVFDINNYSKKQVETMYSEYIIIAESIIILFLIIIAMLLSSKSKKLKKIINSKLEKEEKTNIEEPKELKENKKTKKEKIKKEKVKEEEIKEEKVENTFNTEEINLEDVPDKTKKKAKKKEKKEKEKERRVEDIDL